MSFLYDVGGNRKYLTQSERSAFLQAASRLPPEVRTFCLTLAYTGARVSEVLALTPRRIDTAARIIVVESLKKRRRGLYRAVPIPIDLIAELDRVHGIAAAREQPERARQRIWSWCRTTAWNWIKACMMLAGIDGPPASPNPENSSVEQFQDDRLKAIGRHLIYVERPDLLDNDMRRDHDRRIADRLLGCDQEAPWLTLPKALEEIDDLITAADGLDAPFLHEHRKRLATCLARHSALVT